MKHLFTLTQSSSLRIKSGLLFQLGLIFLYSFFGMLTTSAQGNDCGTGDTIVWNQDQTIEGVFSVANTDVLQIEPGVNIVFATTDSRLIIQGSIIALGSQALPIVFVNSDPGGWAGIEINSECSSSFSYCNFTGINRNAVKGTDDVGDCGIAVTSAEKVRFLHCNYSLNKDGIGVSNSSNIVMLGCTFENNEIDSDVKGLIYIENSSNDTIRNCIFEKNKVGLKGILSVNSGSNAVIINNKFNKTSFFEAIFQNVTYSVIVSKGGTTANHLVINGNTFSGTFDPNNNDLVEINLSGSNNDVDNSVALIWNNTFYGYPFSPSTSAPKTAIRASYSTLNISQNTIKFYNKCGIRLLNSDAKINVNRFEGNKTTDGVIHFNTYSGYAGRNLNNVVFANYFNGNQATNGAAIWCSILPNERILTTISQNSFINNYANSLDGKGGAIFEENNGNLVIEDNTFEQNHANGAGGAIFIGNASGTQNGLATIYNNEMFNNMAGSSGGAICVSLAKVTIENNNLYENEAVQGGGIYAKSLTGSEFSNNIIKLNSASEGGGIYVEGSAGLDFSKNRSGNDVTFTDNVIENNLYSEKGGGCFVNNSNNAIFIRNMFASNQMDASANDHQGGGLYAVNSNLEFYNCNFVNNTANENNGAVYMDIGLTNTLTFNNCNVVNHGVEGGIFFQNNILPAGIEIYNTLFYGNNQGTTGKAIIYTAENLLVTNDCYFDFLPSGFNVSNQNTHIAVSPGFEDVNNFYLVCDNSVCVDAGNGDQIFNDLPGAEPTLALFPSCGSLTNDIGISGGPFAFDNPLLFITEAVQVDSPERISDINKQEKLKSLSAFEADFASEKLISVYPNPTEGIVNISVGENEINMISFTLFDAFSRVVKSYRDIALVNNLLQINLSDNPKGVYFIKIEVDGQSFTKKIVLN